MVARESNPQIEIVKKHYVNVYWENIALLTLLLKRLPEELSTRVEELEDLRKEINPKSPKELHKNKEFRNLFGPLLEDILTHLNLSPKMYTHYIAWYLLYGKVKAPFMNFLITPTQNSVIVEFTRNPTTNDWIMAKAMVEQHFKYMSKIHKARIDPRHAKTINRRIVSSKYEDGYDALDELFGEVTSLSKEEVPKAQQKLAQIRLDKKRFKSLLKKID
jgi:hypothetical protein